MKRCWDYPKVMLNLYFVRDRLCYFIHPLLQSFGSHRHQFLHGHYCFVQIFHQIHIDQKGTSAPCYMFLAIVSSGKQAQYRIKLIKCLLLIVIACADVLSTRIFHWLTVQNRLRQMLAIAKERCAGNIQISLYFCTNPPRKCYTCHEDVCTGTSPNSTVLS